MEEWRNVRFFPGYSVSDLGSVRNEDTGHRMSVLINQRGIPHVGLTRNRIQHKRAIAPLVAEVWLPRPHVDAFDTPINLNGDRLINSVSNLAWRPRWFAIRFFRQFLSPDHAIFDPLEEIKSGEVFDGSWDVVKQFGLLNHDIILSMMNNTYVWPTFQRFRIFKGADTGTREKRGL